MELSSKDVYKFTELTKLKESGIDLTGFTLRQKIEIMEWVLIKEFENIADDLLVTKVLVDKKYYRALNIPQGVLLTGKVHLMPHMCMVIKGDISVMTDDGVKRVKAPYIYTAESGIKKIGYAHEDTVFLTVQDASSDDMEKIEYETLIDSDLTWVDELMNNKLKEVQVCQQ
jgi:hypothetical protein